MIGLFITIASGFQLAYADFNLQTYENVAECEAAIYEIVETNGHDWKVTDDGLFYADVVDETGMVWDVTWQCKEL